jgi:hypothetical protein
MRLIWTFRTNSKTKATIRVVAFVFFSFADKKTVSTHNRRLTNAKNETFKQARKSL